MDKENKQLVSLRRQLAGKLDLTWDVAVLRDRTRFRVNNYMLIAETPQRIRPIRSLPTHRQISSAELSPNPFFYFVIKLLGRRGVEQPRRNIIASTPSCYSPAYRLSIVDKRLPRKLRRNLPNAGPVGTTLVTAHVFSLHRGYANRPGHLKGHQTTVGVKEESNKLC